MEYVPAISILIALLIIFLSVLWKTDRADFGAMLSGKGFLVLSTLLLFGLILVLHMFEAQAWTADVLKVIIGVILGLATSYAAQPRKSDARDGSGVDVASSTFGDDAQIAGRDINRISNLVDRMEAEVAEIRDSVFNQYRAVQEVLPSIGPQSNTDFLINTIYERGMERAVGAMQHVINRWHSEGWLLNDISSDYQGMDGIILVFQRPAQGLEPRSFFYHGSKMQEVEVVLAES